MDPNGFPRTPKATLRDPKDIPRRSQGHPWTPEDVPRHPQSSLTTAQGAPKTPKDSKGMPMDPNGASKDLQRTQKSPKINAKILKELLISEIFPKHFTCLKKLHHFQTLILFQS